ncbi:MAG: ABC transporter ATP-binding protein [Bacteroidetes bacterium]|nr:ABC transporter ATP-binding protein [Bacteroidota bacterium]
MATIELKNISKQFQTGVEAVNNVSLKIEEGEFVVLVGPSGCGKTTILRMIAGLETITDGDILLDNVVANNIEPHKRNIGMVFQEYALYPHLNVFDNIAFPLKVLKRNNKKITKQEIKNKVLEILDTLELASFINHKPKELSGGQRQRVALGRALVRNPGLFLFDEPLSNLDAKLRVTLRQEIINLHKKFGITSIYVTHDQIEAMTMGDKIAVLKDGCLQQYATPFEIYNNPNNLFVADFIGSASINVFEGSIKNNIFYENNSDINFKINNKSNVDLKDIKYAAIRPELINIGNNYENNINIKIENVEFIGSETLLYFTTGKTKKRIICSPTQDIKTNMTILCSFQSDAILLFDDLGNRVW